MHRLVCAKGGCRVAKTALTDAEVLALLSAATPRIAALTTGLGEAQLQAAPAPGEWSATEVLAHLRACGDMWGDCIIAIIAHDHPTLPAINPRTWIDETDYRELFTPRWRPSRRSGPSSWPCWSRSLQRTARGRRA
jgi:hypothetical protein